VLVVLIEDYRLSEAQAYQNRERILVRKTRLEKI
jgi:hypothetical protein